MQAVKSGYQLEKTQHMVQAIGVSIDFVTMITSRSDGSRLTPVTVFFSSNEGKFVVITIVPDIDISRF